jgi:hypothetical protein
MKGLCLIEKEDKDIKSELSTIRLAFAQGNCVMKTADDVYFSNRI